MPRCEHGLKSTECYVCVSPKYGAYPMREPFGYLWPTGRHPEFRFTQQRRDGVDGMPLYTAPPQRKPLPQLAQSQCPHPEGHPSLRDAWLDGWEAAERAHGIGGQE